MPRGKELSPYVRTRICERRRCGYSYREIHKLFPEIPLSTIRSTVNREAQRVDNNSLPRSGQPRKLSEENRQLIRNEIDRDPHIQNRELLFKVNNVCKVGALRAFLRDENRRKWLQRKRPLLLPEHAAKRLAWAEQYKDIDWNCVIWSDECGVVRGRGKRPIWTFLRPKDQLLQGDVQEVRRQGAVRQMFWAAFSHQRRSGLIALDGRVNGQHIVDLYSAILPDIVGPGDIFMHDNAPSHTAYIVRALLRELRIEVMIWPPYSPDLNPIENLWALMKAEIYLLYPELEFAPDNADTLNRLVAAAKEAWHAIEDHIHQSLIDSLPRRVAAIIEAHGWYTKY